MPNIAIDYSTVLGRGGTATIYAVVNSPHLVAKIYNNPNQVAQEKLEELLNRLIGCEIAGHLAVPIDIMTGPLGVTGYTQPYFPSTHYLPLHYWIEGKLNRRLSTDQSDLLFRIRILSSLADSISILHSRNIAIVDLKPSNILVHRNTGNVAIVDCDAFCVLDDDGTILFPAQEVTPGYCNGVALRNHTPANELSYEQDAFAYSVIAFQLLNNRIHPFQGVSFSNDNSFNIDDLVKRGTYPYGSKASSDILPISHSTHDLLPPKLFEAFERSFAPRRKRIDIDQWRDIFATVLSSDLLEPCQRRKPLGLHHKFRNFQCSTCRSYDLATTETLPEPPRPEPGVRPSPQPPKPPHQPIPPTTGPSQLTGGQVAILMAVVSVGIVAGVLALTANSRHTPNTSPTIDQSVPSPTPQLSPEPETQSPTSPTRDTSTLTNYEVCGGALNSAKTDWDKSNSYSRFLSEAGVRSLSIDDCRKEFGLAPLAVESVLKLTSLANSDICYYALQHLDGNWDDRYPHHVEEARRRGLSLNDCRRVLTPSSSGASDITPTNSKTFETFYNCDIRAVDLAARKTASSSECQALCIDDADCEAFVFNKWENFCILKQKLEFSVYEPQADCSILTKLKVRHDKGVKWGKALKNYRFVGGNVISRSNSVSRAECETECNESESCSGYNYRPARYECELLSRMDRKFVRSDGSEINYLRPKK